MSDFQPLPADPTQPLLFVYGSLKRGQRAHHLLQGLPWLGQAWLPGACLHDLGPFPMAVLGEGSIQGELYGVSEADLAALDRFEGAPRLYQRHWLSLADGRSAWVYLGRPHQVRHVAPLASGCWLGPSVPKPRRSGKWEARAPAKVTFGALTQALILALVMAGGLRPSWAFDTLGACQAWQNSRGRARIEIAGVILPGFVVNAEREPRRQHPAGISRTRTNSNCRRASPLAGDGGGQFIAAIQH
jgi:gamma-glutamylcyclotransferase (GGCT)/AIG2-like uncharacterized protein YtfP